ncbi:MAG: nicotinate-nucleotide adenylyltransferase [Peptococcaceae bacterium]|nr:nicotinate-nucleotide adenylyltransferase [Peptococcaceae bacterium]
MKKIGIMGGTFDPIHYGHLVTAEIARHSFGLERVIFIPAGIPPHKDNSAVADYLHRFNMLKIAIESNSYFELSDIEIERQGPSYTFDTVSCLKEIWPATEFYFISGADAVLEILTWHRASDLLEICFFIAATRPGFSLENLKSVLKALSAEYIDKILLLEVPALAISSSDIRHRVGLGLPIKYLLPEKVERYIFDNSLYQKG